MITDVDGDEIAYTVFGDVDNGTRGIITNSTSTPTVTFTPDSNWNGSTSLVIRGSDGQSNTDGDATVTIVVNAVNDAPTITNVSDETNQDNPVNIFIDILHGVTADIDNTDSDMTWIIVSQPSNGSATTNSGVVTYTPNTGWTGQDSFTYKVNDGQLDSNIATATITVNSSLSYSYDSLYYEHGTGNTPSYAVTSASNLDLFASKSFSYSAGLRLRKICLVQDLYFLNKNKSHQQIDIYQLEFQKKRIIRFL